MSLERQRSYGHAQNDVQSRFGVSEYTPAPTESILSLTCESYSCRSCAKEYTRFNTSNTLERSLGVCHKINALNVGLFQLVVECTWCHRCSLQAHSVFLVEHPKWKKSDLGLGFEVFLSVWIFSKVEEGVKLPIHHTLESLVSHPSCPYNNNVQYICNYFWFISPLMCRIHEKCWV